MRARALKALLAAVILFAATFVAVFGGALPASATVMGNGWTQPLTGTMSIEAGYLANSCTNPAHPGYGGYGAGLYHIGVDYRISTADAGLPVYALGAGTVRKSQLFSMANPDEGYVVMIEHVAPDGSHFVAVYGHLNNAGRPAVTNPDGSPVTVAAGQQIGTLYPLAADPYGGPHLHLGIVPGTTIPSSGWGTQPCSAWPGTNGFTEPMPYLNAHGSGGGSTTPPPPPAHWVPLAGDWDDNGTITIGVYNPNTATFYLRNSNTPGNADITAVFGSGGTFVPVVGDWNGDGKDTIGVYDPSTARFYLSNTNTSPNSDISAVFGSGGTWRPVVGDWDGNGTTTIGVYNPATASFYLSNSNTSPNTDVAAIFGSGGSWEPVMGDWDGNGTTTIGVYSPNAAAFYLSNSNTSPNSDISFTYGNPN